MKYLLTFLLFLCISLCLLLFWAVGPALPPQKFPRQAILTYSLSNQTQAPTSKDKLTIVTYNMGYASGKKNNLGAVLTKTEINTHLNQMILALKELNPDIVMLQEVDFDAHRSFDTNQMEVLAHGLGLPHVAYAVTWNHRYLPWPYWPPSHQFGKIVSGQAVLSRYPIKNQTPLRFEKPKDNAFWYNWFYLNRLVQKLEIAWPGEDTKTLTLYHAHLEAFSAPTRAGQIKMLGDWINENKGENTIIIAGGDFNAVWQSQGQPPKQQVQDQKVIQEFLTDTELRMVEAKKLMLSFPSWQPQERIDFIFYDRNFNLVKGGTSSNLMASDHVPVWGRFGLSP